jgi:tetratricopeptide (TPR) repeat protein
VSWALVSERAARREAEASRNLARTESARNEEVARFFTSMGDRSDSYRGQDTKVVHFMLDSLSTRVGRLLTNQPGAQGDLWVSVGGSYTTIGDYPRATKNFQLAVDAYRKAFDKPQVRLAAALGRLGRSQNLNKEFAAGRTNALLGVAMARKCNDPETLADCLLDAARSFHDSERFEPEAIPLLREAMHLRKSVVPSYFALIESTRLLAKALASDGKKDEAKELAQKALEQAPTDTDLREFLARLDTAPAEADSNRTP